MVSDRVVNVTKIGLPINQKLNLSAIPNWIQCFEIDPDSFESIETKLTTKKILCFEILKVLDALFEGLEASFENPSLRFKNKCFVERSDPKGFSTFSH